jgi:hypothetical protein
MVAGVRRAAIAAAASLVLSLASPAPARAGGWSWPLRGEVIALYRNGDDPYAAGQHRGIDVAGPVGAPVVAAAAGTVRFAGSAGWSGLAVTVRTEDGRYDTSYLHLSSARVREGEQVRAKQRIGAVGTSGRPSDPRPHLHFGVRDAGSRHAYHDPLEFLSRPGAPPSGPRSAPEPVRLAPRPAPPRALRPVEPPTPLPALRPIGAPAGAPLPAARRVRAPVGNPARAPVPDAVPVALPRPLHAHAPGGAGLTAGVSAAGRFAPAAPAERQAQVEDAPGIGDVRGLGQHAPAERATKEPGPGPDVGLALACLGLLLAAAFMGGARDGRSASARARTRLAGLLRLSAGRA